MAATVFDICEPSDTFSTDEFITLFIHTLTRGGEWVTIWYTKLAIAARDRRPVPSPILLEQWKNVSISNRVFRRLKW